MGSRGVGRSNSAWARVLRAHWLRTRGPRPTSRLPQTLRPTCKLAILRHHLRYLRHSGEYVLLYRACVPWRHLAFSEIRDVARQTCGFCENPARPPGGGRKRRRRRSAAGRPRRRRRGKGRQSGGRGRRKRRREGGGIIWAVGACCSWLHAAPPALPAFAASAVRHSAATQLDITLGSIT